MRSSEPGTIALAAAGALAAPAQAADPITRGPITRGIGGCGRTASGGILDAAAAARGAADRHDCRAWPVMAGLSIDDKRPGGLWPRCHARAEKITGAVRCA